MQGDPCSKELRGASDQLEEVGLVTEIFAPENANEASEFIRSHDRISIFGQDQHRAWCCDEPASAGISSQKMSQILRIEPADQVAEFESGITLTEAQAALKERGQCLPWRSYFEGDAPSLGGAVSLALPHYGEADHGSWRDWVLGFTLIREDGTITKGGSSAMKNVAGYDLHRFIAGTRGSLGFFSSLILRTAPLKSLPPEQEQTDGSRPLWIQRVHRANWAEASAGAALLGDQETCTLIFGETPKRFPGDWVIASGQEAANLEAMSPDTRFFWDRFKRELDPSGKWGHDNFGRQE